MKDAFIRNVTLFLILGVTVIGYCASMTGDFLIDDERMMQSSFVIKTPSDIVRIFAKGFDFDVTAEAAPSRANVFPTYRPIPILSLLALKSLASNNTWPFHLFNLLLHLTAITLAFLWMKAFFQSQWAVFLGTALFAFHPFHTDAVSWINGLSDVIAFIFMALSAGLLMSRRVNMLLSAALFFLALLSKETSLAFLAIFPFLLKAVDRPRREKVAIGLAYGFVVLIWLALRKVVMGSVEVDATTAFSSKFLLAFPTFVVETIPKLFSFFSVHVVMLADEWKWGAPSHLQNVVAIVGWVGGLALYVHSVRSPTRHRIVVFFWIYVMFLIPVLYLLQFRYASPRMFYTSIFGVAGAVAGIADWATISIKRVQGFLKGSSLLLVALMAISLPLRARDYQSAKALWKSETVNNPTSAYGFQYYGARLMGEGNAAGALPFVERAAQLEPNAVPVLNNLGLCHLYLGQLDQAELQFQRILSGAPQNCKALYHLALVARARGKLDVVKEQLQETIRVCPDYERARQLSNEIERSKK